MKFRRTVGPRYRILKNQSIFTRFVRYSDLTKDTYLDSDIEGPIIIESTGPKVFSFSNIS